MRLLNASPQEIAEILGEMKKDSRAIRKNISELIFHMKGSITLAEAWEMSADSRNMLVKTFNDNNKKKPGFS